MNNLTPDPVDQILVSSIQHPNLVPPATPSVGPVPPATPSVDPVTSATPSVDPVTSAPPSVGPVTSAPPRAKQKKPRDSVFRTILLCLAFDIFLGSCALIWNYLASFAESSIITWDSLNSHGGLLAISVAITGSALGTLVSSRKEKIFQDDKGLALFCSALLSLMVTSGWYNFIVFNSQVSNTDGIRWVSLVLYGVSVFVSVGCRLITRE